MNLRKSWWLLFLHENRSLISPDCLLRDLVHLGGGKSVWQNSEVWEEERRFYLCYRDVENRKVIQLEIHNSVVPLQCSWPIWGWLWFFSSQAQRIVGGDTEVVLARVGRTMEFKAALLICSLFCLFFGQHFPLIPCILIWWSNTCHSNFLRKFCISHIFLKF